jgi:hypothetical protein
MLKFWKIKIETATSFSKINYYSVQKLELLNISVGTAIGTVLL